MVLDWQQQKAERKFLFDEFKYSFQGSSLKEEQIEIVEKTKEILDFIIGKTGQEAKEGADLDALKDDCAKGIKEIIKLYNKELDIEKVCTHIEKLALTDESQKIMQEAFAPIKAEYLEKEKQFEKELNLVQDELLKIGTNEQVKKQIGSGNAEMIANMAQKINDNLKVVTKQSHRAQTLAEGIKEIQKFVENAEKQASKGKFDRVKDVLKSALKVIITGGADKNAKLEFAAAKFAMNNKNAEQIKAYSKEQLSTRLTASTQSINKAQEGRGR